MRSRRRRHPCRSPGLRPGQLPNRHDLATHSVERALRRLTARPRWQHPRSEREPEPDLWREAGGRARDELTRSPAHRGLLRTRRPTHLPGRRRTRDGHARRRRLRCRAAGRRPLVRHCRWRAGTLAVIRARHRAYQRSTGTPDTGVRPRTERHPYFAVMMAKRWGRRRVIKAYDSTAAAVRCGWPAVAGCTPWGGGVPSASGPGLGKACARLAARIVRGEMAGPACGGPRAVHSAPPRPFEAALPARRLRSSRSSWAPERLGGLLPAAGRRGRTYRG